MTITWQCVCCHDTRDDKDISVLSTETMRDDVELRFNVRYCNDRPGCRAVAQFKAAAWERRFNGRTS